MQDSKIVTFIENSFLYELIKDEDITDISFNGYSLYYLHNYQGRKESNIKISNSDAKDFIRQIANLTEKQFSYQNPILDVTAGKYRINAVHNSIGRYGENQVITFSIRIASTKPRITDKSGFLTPELLTLFNALLMSGMSIVIGGITGSGKTEFQKYLLRKMPLNTRVIVIDNVLELSQVDFKEKIDINVWQADEKNLSTSIQLLVKNALRSNPDWLIIAESRGGEMLEILNSAMTGHPVITTIHAQNIENMPHRLTRMVMMNDKRSDYHDVYDDVKSNFPVYVFLKRFIDKDGRVYRRIDSIAMMDKEGKLNLIYQYKNDKHIYSHIGLQIYPLANIENELFIKTFGGAANENL